MRPLFNLLLALAVLWCGLHVSPAEAVQSREGAPVASVHSHAESEQGDNHAKPHATHACHHHCPVAADGGLSAADDAVIPEPALHHVVAVAALRPIVAAPPVEPPSA